MTTNNHHLPPVDQLYLDAQSRHQEMRQWTTQRKQQWVMQLLEQYAYPFLSRDEKGKMRRYIQDASGYSRAHVARLISAFGIAATSSQQPAILQEAPQRPPASRRLPRPLPRSPLRRTLLLASIGINIALVSMLLGAAFWETVHLSKQNIPPPVQATTLPTLQP